MNKRVLTLFAALTLLMTMPLALDLSRQFAANAGDPAYTMWTMTWEAHALETAPDQFLNANIFYPDRGTLAYSTLNLSPMLVGLPIWLVTRNSILAYNAAFLFAWLVIGYGTFLLARTMGISPVGSVIAGLAAEFSSFTFGQIDHLEILWFGWLPLFLAALGKLLQSRKIDSVVSALIFFLLGSLATWYYALYLTCTGLGLAFYALRRTSWQQAARIVAVIALGWLIMSPFVLPYLPLGGEYMKSRPLSVAENLSVLPFSFLRVPYSNDTWRNIIGTYDGKEGYLFPGIAFLVLIISGAGRMWRDNARGMGGRFLILLGIVTLVLAFGPSLQINGQPVAPLPERILRLLPGYPLTRAPKRWVSFSTCAFAIIAGAGAERIGKKRLLAIAGLGGLILLENAAAPLPVSTLPTLATVEPVYRWLASQPPRVVVELPMATEDRFAVQRIGYMYRSLFHWQSEVNGVGDYVPDWYEPFVIASFTFPMQEARVAFERRGVQLVILHTDQLEADHYQWIQVEIDHGEARDWLVPVARFRDTIVYQTRSTSDVATRTSLTPRVDPRTSLVRRNDRTNPLFVARGPGSAPLSSDLPGLY
ncbi:MAG: hypothetical protein WCF84_02055 [Anaerolineae bacterium]